MVRDYSNSALHGISRFFSPRAPLSSILPTDNNSPTLVSRAAYNSRDRDHARLRVRRLTGTLFRPNFAGRDLIICYVYLLFIYIFFF